MDLLISFVERFLEDRFEDDAFDRLNYQITPFLFVLFSLVNISKLYIGSPINCFTKAEFRPGWIQYAHDYCLIENTYYLRTNESIPIEHETRGQKYISYYQWVPFILVLQACSFYVPHVIWRSFNWISGFQIRTIVKTAKESAVLPQAENREVVLKIARSMYHATKLRHRTLNMINPQMLVTFLYMTMKLSYLLLICFHLFVFKHFIGNLSFAFGVIEHRGEWEKSGLFPRVTVCDFSILRFGQQLNFTLECVLPLNMFNEKIFVFFYFWLIFMFGLTVISIFIWAIRLRNRTDFYLRLLRVYSQNEHITQDGSSSSTATTPLTPLKAGTLMVRKEVLDFGCDLRVVMGIMQDHTGLIFCANVFREMCNLKEAANNNYRDSTESPLSEFEPEDKEKRPLI